MEISAFLDWISVTHKGLDKDHLPELVNRTYVSGKATNGYTQSRLYQSGIIEMFNPAHPIMGVHIVYSGKVLAKLENEHGLSRDEILLHHVANGGNVSRIDLTLDVMNSGLNLDDIWGMLECDAAITNSQHSRTQSGDDKGYTVYVGSRKTRKKMIRIYDKAKEMDMGNIDYKRIELEVRQDIARNAVRQYLQGELNPKIIRQMIIGVVDFPFLDVWNNIFDCDVSKIPVATSGDGNTEKWLYTQVAPALAKVKAFNPNFYNHFIEHVDFLVNQLVTKDSPNE